MEEQLESCNNFGMEEDEMYDFTSHQSRSANIKIFNIILDDKPICNIFKDDTLDYIREDILDSGYSFDFYFLNKGKPINKEHEKDIMLSEIQAKTPSLSGIDVFIGSIKKINKAKSKKNSNNIKATDYCDFIFPDFNQSNKLIETKKVIGDGGFGIVSLLKYLSINLAKKSFHKNLKSSLVTFKLELNTSQIYRNLKSPIIYGYINDFNN